MANKKIDEEIRERLRAPFPARAISLHPTKTYLSTLKAIYVVERLNDIFGMGGWTIEHEIISDTSDYVTIKGRLIIGEPFAIKTPYQYGGHKKIGKNTEPADGYKSAVTDCLSKCASYLEIGIDIFKGLHSEKDTAQPRETAQPTTSKKDGEISKKQWEYIKKIGAEKDLAEPEVIELVQWVAKENDISPRHWKIAKLLLPVENFERRLDEFITAHSTSTISEEDVPF